MRPLAVYFSPSPSAAAQNAMSHCSLKGLCPWSCLHGKHLENKAEQILVEPKAAALQTCGFPTPAATLGFGAGPFSYGEKLSGPLSQAFYPPGSFELLLWLFLMDHYRHHFLGFAVTVHEFRLAWRHCVSQHDLSGCPGNA